MSFLQKMAAPNGIFVLSSDEEDKEMILLVLFLCQQLKEL